MIRSAPWSTGRIAAMRRQITRGRRLRAAGIRMSVALLVVAALLAPGLGTVVRASTGELYIGQFGSFGVNDGQFDYPNSIAIGHGGSIDGKVFVADNNRIQEFSASGQFLSSFGQVVCGHSPDEYGINLVAGPASIASDNNGNIYALYGDNAGTGAGGPGGNFLRVYDFHTSFPSTGDCPTTQQFSNPHSIAVDNSGNLYVSEAGQGVQEFSPGSPCSNPLGCLRFVRQFGTPGQGPHPGAHPLTPDELATPGALTIDSSGNLYVVDAGTHRVVEFDPSGAVVQDFGYNTDQPVEFTGPGELGAPRGVAVDAHGNVYVGDPENYRITEFSPSGVALSQIDHSGFFFLPTAIAIEGSVIYVADSSANVVVEYGIVGAPVTESNNATTIDASSPLQARVSSLNATPAGGLGTVTVANYASNPTGVTLADANDAFFDVRVSRGSSFSSLTVARCGASATDKVNWYDGLLWRPVSPQSYDATTGCVTMNLDNTSSSPTVAQLTGTPFAIGTPAVTSRQSALTLLSPAPLGSVVGQSVTVTATVTTVGAGAAVPGGTITFYDGGAVLGVSALTGGQAAFTTSGLGVGAHPITATYSGDANDLGNVAPVLNQQVSRDSTTLSLTGAPNPSAYGQIVIVTATVASVAPGSGTPTGPVTFYDDGSMLGTGTLDGHGQATVSTGSLGVGTRGITATYGGDTNDNASASLALSQQVNRDTTTTALTAAPSPSTVGQAVTFTATVAVVAPGVAAPTGQITFLDGGATLGTSALNSAGVATFTTTTLSVGAHSVTAVYGGDANDSASTSAAVSQRVTPKPLQLVLSSATNPSGPTTNGSVITVNGALTNHTTTAQRVTLNAALVYVSGRTHVTASVSNVSLQLAPGQTVGRTFSFRVQSYYPRGAYTLTLTATDAGGDTDSGSVSLTIV